MLRGFFQDYGGLACLAEREHFEQFERIDFSTFADFLCRHGLAENEGRRFVYDCDATVQAVVYADVSFHCRNRSLRAKAKAIWCFISVSSFLVARNAAAS